MERCDCCPIKIPLRLSAISSLPLGERLFNSMKICGNTTGLWPSRLLESGKTTLSTEAVNHLYFVFLESCIIAQISYAQIYVLDTPVQALETCMAQNVSLDRDAWVAHEHAFLHVWLNRTSLVLLNEDICKTSPNSEIRDIGFPLEPGFIESHAFERGHRKAVPDMDLSCECFPPKRGW